MNLRIRPPRWDVAGAMNVTSGTSAGQGNITSPTPDHMAPKILEALPLAVDGSAADRAPAALAGGRDERAAHFAALRHSVESEVDCCFASSGSLDLRSWSSSGTGAAERIAETLASPREQNR